MKSIQRMYAHLHWANQRLLQTLQNIKKENREALRLFSHILYTEQVWLARLQGIDSSQLPIWAEADLTVCEELVKQNEERFTVFLTDLEKKENRDLDKLITYTNSKGQEFKTTLRDILTHVALHGQYHRGQINSRLRAEGLEPTNIDFITFVR